MPIKNLNSITVGESSAIDVKEIAWNPSDGTFDMGLLNDVVLQAGQEMHFYGKAQGAISNGDAVMFVGAQGDHLLMSAATQAAINANPEYFVGIATQDFVNNQFGYVTSFGKVRGLDTTIYRNGDPSSEGKILWFDSEGSTAGALTTVTPEAPNAKIRVAAVTRDHQNQGSIFVRPMVEPKLTQLQDVETSNVSRNDLLVWNDVSERWENGSNTNDFATAAQGSLADSAVQPADLGTMAYEDASDYVDLTSNQRIGGRKDFQREIVGSVNTGQNNLKLWSLRGRTYQSGDQFMGVYMVGLSGSNSLVLGGGTGSVKGATKISFQTNPNSELLGSTERMVITGNGNVGIGTTSPYTKLEVVGTISSGAGSSATNLGMEFGGLLEPAAMPSQIRGVIGALNNGTGVTAGSIGYQPRTGVGASHIFFTEQSEKMRITSTGNVGIGTTSPSSELDVNGDGRFSGELILNTNGTYLRAKNTSNAETRIHGINSSNIEYIGSVDTLISGTNIGNNTSYVSLRVGNNEKLKVDATQTTIRGTGTGNAGILELRDGDSARKLILKSSYSGIGWSSINTQTGDLRIGVEGSDVIHIEGSNNNVGIGTTSPAYNLDINKGNSNGSELRLRSRTPNIIFDVVRANPADTGAAFNIIDLKATNDTATTDLIKVGALAGMTQGTSPTFSYLYIGDAYNDNAFRIYGNKNAFFDGKVGIGITSPTEALSIDGKIAINDGGQSVYIGYNSGLNDDATDNRNVGVGHLSMYSNTSGYFNTATGYYSLRLNTTGYYNSAFGYASLYRNTTGYANAASGPLALYNNTDGHNNTATGYQALYANQTGDKNTAQGAQALYQSTADQNTAFGYRASYGNTSGGNNSSFGAFALNSMSTGNYNTGLGSYSMYLSSSGNYNTAVGYQTLYHTSGSQNATLGYRAGFAIASGSSNTSSDKSVFIGADSRPNAVGEENQIAIGYNAIGLGSDTTVIGNSNTKITELKGAVAIGTSSPSYPLDVNGDGRFTGDVRANLFIITSDADLKTNIKEIPDTKLNLSYKEYALKDDTSGRKRYGILADDIKTSYPELVHYNEKGQAGVDYISLLIKKVAELESEISLLNKRLDAARIR